MYSEIQDLTISSGTAHKLKPSPSVCVTARTPNLPGPEWCKFGCFSKQDIGRDGGKRSSMYLGSSLRDKSASEMRSRSRVDCFFELFLRSRIECCFG